MFVKSVDKLKQPTSENLSYTAGLDFNKIWQEAAAQNPEGESYFLDEILTKEQGELEKEILYLTKIVTQLNALRMRTINKGRPAGVILSEQLERQARLDAAKAHLLAVLAYRKKFIK